ncbi:unnamed protein product [Sphagnum jensenii]|uniref:Glycosyltransferase n=1 Tax=Sphagnum jensenii TaxID=128206 RepID=A0ABP0VAV6_9BRYO
MLFLCTDSGDAEVHEGDPDQSFSHHQYTSVSDSMKNETVSLLEDRFIESSLPWNQIYQKFNCDPKDSMLLKVTDSGGSSSSGNGVADKHIQSDKEVIAGPIYEEFDSMINVRDELSSRMRNHTEHLHEDETEWMLSRMKELTARSLHLQKNIWLQQVQHLDPSLFHFVWILTTDIENDSIHTVKHKLEVMNKEQCSRGVSDEAQCGVAVVITPFHDNLVTADQMVVELLNLYPDSSMLPTVFIAPSHYAQQHRSLVEAIGNVAIEDLNYAAKTQVIVIPPAVDLQRFNISTAAQRPIYYHSDVAAMRNHKNKIRPESYTACYVVNIGFMARLAPEVTYLVRDINADYELQFTLGDGEVREYLEELTNRLSIAWAVKFVGIGEYVSSQEMEKESSPRQVDSTFQYCTHQYGGENNCIDGNVDLFSVRTNAVVVNVATPIAIAEAVYYLMSHENVRRAIAEAGYITVVTYFNVERQMKQYEDLYLDLATMNS